MPQVYRTDISVLRPVERRSDGTILVDAHLSKCGVFQYLQPDGSIRRELRLPEDVFDPKSLASFEGRPVTNNHPPGMLDSKNAREYAVGSLLGTPTPDSDHMRGRLSVYDASTVDDMEAGKVQVSNGYTCDTEETPGTHPLYGVYDAIQRNIRGNHVAIVDRARAGITAAARMDADIANGMQILAPGQSASMGIAIVNAACNIRAMASLPTARVEVVVKHDAGQPSASAKVDPDDEASRNAAGGNDAPKSPKAQPGQMADKGGDLGEKRPAPDDDDDDGDADEDMDSSMYDDEGNLTQFGAGKVASASFAIPGKQKLPIHDPAAVKKSMRDFKGHEFDDADEKHAAFNRISGKAKQFGMDTARFEKAHAGNLDRADAPNKDNAMTPAEIKALEEKANKRKEKLVAAKAKIDSLETEKKDLQTKLDAAEAEVENMKRTQKGATSPAPKADAADDKLRIDAMIDLLDRARQTGATVDSKMDEMSIMRATVKHVDGEDIAEGKSLDYVRAVFDGALKRAKKDAAETVAGAAALAGARQAVANAPANAHNDADDADEDAAKARLRQHNQTMWQRSRKEIK